MITPPTNQVEWKIDSAENGATLKRIEGERVYPKGRVVFDDRFDAYRVTWGRDGVQYADDLELAMEILWAWRTGRHHPLCDCDCCARSNPWTGDTEAESE